jgi:CubicO group peptidase (beta-lactamase class C family)
MSAESIARAILDAPSAPLGVAVGVSRAGRREVAALGHTTSAGAPVTRETAFDIASVSKVAATTSALHRLASEGTIGFDAPVASVLASSPCAPGTTIRDLLQHRAGLWEWQPLYLAMGDAFATIDALPLRYPAGAGRHYSDLGFMLLGRIVESVAGAPLDRAVDELVAQPLGLTGTGYRPGIGAPGVAASSRGDATERRMVATGEPYPVVLHDVDADEFAWREHELVGEANDGNCFHAFDGVAGHAGLFSTVDDLLTLGESLASADADASPELWSPAVTAEVFADGPEAGQALGWRSRPIEFDGRTERLLWHPGFTGCALGFIPGVGVAVVMLANRLLAAGEPPTTDSMWQVAVDGVGESSPSTPPPAEMERP